jgi:hypothetical protein
MSKLLGSGRELSHVVMDCCQLEENRGANVKREMGNNQDPENGSPDADPSGIIFF